MPTGKTYCMATNLIPSDRTIAAIKRSDERRRLSDGAGLYLLLWFEGGSHGWRLDYTFGGKRKTISLGTYPATSLALARQKAAEARAQVAAGINPSEARKAARVVESVDQAAAVRESQGLPPLGSFEHVAMEFWRLRYSPDNAAARQWSDSYADRWIGRLRFDVFPYIGRRDLRSLAPRELLEVLRRVERRGAFDTASKLSQSISEVFRHGVVLEYCDSDPARDLRGALRKHLVKHYAAVTAPGEAGDLVRAILAYRGRPITRAALHLSMLVFQRPGNVRAAEWAHVDLDAAMWTIPSQGMKRKLQHKISGRPHLVPLSTQAVEVLRELHPLTGYGRFVFPNQNGGKCMSENTLHKALAAMGFGSDRMTPHGFRAMARTMAVEHLDIDPEVIEVQLAHAKSGVHGEAYDRAQYLAQRRTLMQRWADYLMMLVNQPSDRAG